MKEYKYFITIGSNKYESLVEAEDMNGVLKLLANNIKDYDKAESIIITEVYKYETR